MGYKGFSSITANNLNREALLNRLHTQDMLRKNFKMYCLAKDIIHQCGRENLTFRPALSDTKEEKPLHKGEQIEGGSTDSPNKAGDRSAVLHSLSQSPQTLEPLTHKITNCKTESYDSEQLLDRKSATDIEANTL